MMPTPLEAVEAPYEEMATPAHFTIPLVEQSLALAAPAAAGIPVQAPLAAVGLLPRCILVLEDQRLPPLAVRFDGRSDN